MNIYNLIDKIMEEHKKDLKKQELEEWKKRTEENHKKMGIEFPKDNYKHKIFVVLETQKPTI